MDERQFTEFNSWVAEAAGLIHTELHDGSGRRISEEFSRSLEIARHLSPSLIRFSEVIPIKFLLSRLKPALEKYSKADKPNDLSEIGMLASFVREVLDDLVQLAVVRGNEADQQGFDRDQIEDRKKALEGLVESFRKSVEKFDNTASRYYAQEDRLNEILGKASKVGMSKAFAARATDLFRTKMFWGSALTGLLVTMYCNGLAVIETLAIAAPPLAINWPLVWARSLLALPLIWGAWFSAKQFGYASRLQEDYEFKVASAMSYEGYKDEATAIDTDTEKNLMNTAIHTFSENPLRVFNIPSDPGTPAQEILESLSKASSFVDALGNLRKKE